MDTHESLTSALASNAHGAPEPLRPILDQPFAELYAQYAAFTWRTLRHLGISPMNLDDAVQELWVVVHRRQAQFEGRSDFKTWLFGIAVNLARNYRRSARRHPEPEPLPVALAVQEQDQDPLRNEARAEALALVQGFLDTLDEQRRQVFVCALLEGWSALETAQATGLAESMVQNRVRALRRSFKTWIERQRGTP